MGPSKPSNNSLLFIKYRKIDHGKSMMNIPKVSKEVGGILKFQLVHKSPPSSSPILPKDDS